VRAELAESRRTLGMKFFLGFQRDSILVVGYNFIYAIIVS
jgi:hypothetical protein